MNATQASAFLSAAGINHSAASVLVISILAAVIILWGGNVIRKMGMQTLNGQMKQTEFVVYAIRAMVLVMMVIYLFS